jgi:hypothetical protein
MIGPDRRPTARASIFFCLWLAVCAAVTKAPPWLKAGADDPTIVRELRECETQASDAFASERTIIDKKLV